EKSEPPVAVIIAKRRAGGPVPQRHSGFYGNIGEGAVVVVVVKAILAEICHVEVGPAVVVVIANGAAESPAVVFDPGDIGDVGKRLIVIVAEERSVRRRGLAVERVVGRSVDQINVEPAVVVV